MSTTKLIPQDARTTESICDLSHDNVLHGDFYMLLNEKTVVLGEHPQGGDERQILVIPRDALDAFVKWYTTGEVPRGDARARRPAEVTP